MTVPHVDVASVPRRFVPYKQDPPHVLAGSSLH